MNFSNSTMESRDCDKRQNDNSFKDSINIPYLFLKIANQHIEMKPLLEEFVLEIKKLTKCDSVGIRMLDTEGNIPYEAYQGFSKEFYQSESPLSIKSDKCMCINVIKGEADPELSFYTKRGSFFMNATTKFLATVSEEEKGETRNICNLTGYESVALIAISLEDRILGLIHLADHHENMVPLEIVEILENVAMQLATAIQRVWIQQELKDSEKKFSQLFKYMLEGFAFCKIITDENNIPVDFIYLEINDAFERLTGLKKEETVGKRVTELMPGIKNFSSDLIKIYGKVALTRENTKFEIFFEPLKIWLSIMVYSPKKNYFVTVFDNITDRKKADQKLRESEEKFRMLFESSTDGITSVDMEGRIIDVNNAYLTMLGYSKEELLRLNFRDITPQKWHEMEDNLIASQLSGASDSVIYEKEYIKKDGTILPINARFWIIKDAQGDPVRIGGIVRDITDRKKKEKEIFDLAQFPSEDPYPVLRVNRNRVMYINDVGQNLLNIVDNDQIPKFFQENVKVTFESNQISETEIELDGRNYSFAITPVKEADYVNIYGMDITERKQINEKLKEINELKSEFLRRASHELKTPLISIKGFSELIIDLYEDQLDEPIISKIREINDGCERLQSIINNLLKASKLELQDLKPKVQKEDLSFLIKFCVSELEPMSEKRKQSIKLDVPPELYANFEKEEIHDVISNLLTNAIKYTPIMGEIEIKTELKENNVVVSVKDNGIGFTEWQKTKIFQQFGKIERYGQGLDLGIEGTGLGLFISKQIVESHDGKIWMESEGKNKGSSFYFTLPTIDKGLL